MANKICNKCKINKQAEDFSVDKRSPHGLLQSWCRACVSDSSKIRSKKLVAEARLAREVAREELDKIKIEEKRVAIEKKRLKIEEARVLRNKKSNDYYLTNKKSHLVLLNKYYLTEKSKFVHWRSGARKRGLVWELTEDDLKAMQKVCHYTGQELTLEPNKPNTISLDRLDSSKGYLSSNVVYCCARVNTAKSNLTVDDFVELCRSVASHNCV